MITAKAAASISASASSTRPVISRARSQLVNSTMIEPTLTVAMLKSTMLSSIRAMTDASMLADSFEKGYLGNKNTNNLRNSIKSGSE